MGNRTVKISILNFILFALFFSLCSIRANGQTKGDILITLSKYIQNGDADKLSTWFADNLDIDLLGQQIESSKSQAKFIVKDFFEQHTPVSFELLHKSGNPQMRYALGRLKCTGENFRVILLVRTKEKSSVIVRLKIEREN